MNLKDPINYQHIQRDLARANAIEFDGCLPHNVEHVLSRECQRAGTSLAYVMHGLIGGVGVNMYKADLKALNQFVFPIFYTGLVAQPSTGKSAAMNFTVSAIESVERFMRLSDTESVLIQAPTVEGLFDHISKRDVLAAFYDEASGFFSAMGRYAKGNGDYELSQYLEYWNGKPMLRDLKGVSTKCVEPRLNIMLCMHTWSVMQALIGLRHGHDNGLYHRFNLFCPTTKKLTANDIINAPESISSITSIIYCIRAIHRYIRRHYTLSSESLAIVSKDFDLYNEYVELCNRFDFFLGALCGKATMHTFRFCLFVKALSVAVRICSTLPDAGSPELTVQFEEACLAAVDVITPESFIIEPEILNHARNLTVHCSKVKMVLASYSFDTSSEFDDIMRCMFQNQFVKPTISGIFLNYDTKIVNVMKRILTLPHSDIDTPLALNGNGNNELALKAMNALKKHGFGTTVEKKNLGNYKTVTHFIKIRYQQLVDNPNLHILITQLGLILPEILSNFLSTETREHEIGKEKLRIQNKRHSPEANNASKVTISSQVTTRHHWNTATQSAANDNEPKKFKLFTPIVRQNSNNQTPFILKTQNLHNIFSNNAFISNTLRQTQFNSNNNIISYSPLNTTENNNDHNGTIVISDSSHDDESFESRSSIRNSSSSGTSLTSTTTNERIKIFNKQSRSFQSQMDSGHIDESITDDPQAKEETIEARSTQYDNRQSSLETEIPMNVEAQTVTKLVSPVQKNNSHNFEIYSPTTITNSTTIPSIEAQSHVSNTDTKDTAEVNSRATASEQPSIPSTTSNDIDEDDFDFLLNQRRASFFQIATSVETTEASNANDNANVDKASNTRSYQNIDKRTKKNLHSNTQASKTPIVDRHEIYPQSSAPVSTIAPIKDTFSKQATSNTVIPCKKGRPRGSKNKNKKTISTDSNQIDPSNGTTSCTEERNISDNHQSLTTTRDPMPYNITKLLPSLI